MNLFLRYFILLFLSTNAFSQNIWDFSQNKNKIVIPFQLLNNSIIVQPKVNDIQLNLILDTGSGYNILFAFPEKDSIAFNNTSKIKITGPGMDEPIDAYISKNNKIEFKSLSSKKLDVVLMLEDKYSFTTSVGIPIHGILGADFFMDNIVEIQYDTKRIVVYRKVTNRYESKIINYKQLPFILKDKKPYIPVTINIEDKKIENLELLVDTGLSDGLWIFEKELDVKNKKQIDDYLGAGIGGNVYGKRVRFKNIIFSDYEFKEPIISMPDTISFLKKNILNQRDGSVGGEILKRFNVIFNYNKQIMYLDKNSYFNNKFYYNMAGFNIHHNGVEVIEEKIETDLPTGATNVTELLYDNSKVNFKYVLKPGIEISNIRKNSVADKAGLKVDDRIISINGKKAINYRITEIMEMLQKSANETITIEVERKGKKFIAELFLEEEI
ncbi:pepsin/retropepsin-like aspartic protease family protein [Flavobacterium terrigena]|uniref:PDZ domain (Also known as DHR or GLGF) n=1 Tax=Flavobacterium terrigena TaxID=402734 RepID=A0A1H6Q2V5_9FLAO|nr:PDZ domain-containing protein [Flavobacterium terrigena]SEI38179.1 PDZ domain (Also known as DHR or GLGF) [Flavobacterium terrigena]